MCVCVCVVYLLPVNEQFLVWWTNACTEQKGAAAGLGWTCWHPCGWENRCWAKISIKSGKAPWVKWGKPLHWVNMAKVTVTGPYLSAMTDKIFIDDIWVTGDQNASTCGYFTCSGKWQVTTPWVSQITNFLTIDQNTFNTCPSEQWRHISGSTLAEVMACYLMAPSHYLNQCWLMITVAFTSEQFIAHEHNLNMCTEVTLIELLPHLPGANKLKSSQCLRSWPSSHCITP